MKQINVFSAFDGKSGGQIALKRMGIPVANYFASEIDKYAMIVTKNNFPNTIQLGDITGISGHLLPKIDLVLGGSPCQGFSFAGQGLAFDDPRSKLFFEYVRMKKEHLNVISEYLAVDPICINSALVSAQNRVRYYWTNIPGIEQPKNKGLLFKNVLEESPSAEYNHSQKGLDYLNRRGAKGRNRFDFGYIHDISRSKSKCLVANLYKGLPFNTLVDDCKNPPKTVGGGTCRKLTPIECERLQTLPDNYTAGVLNTQRYKMIGNGWTIDVIVHILKNMEFQKSLVFRRKKHD